MSADRSANVRFELTAEIAQVERREDEFSELRSAYERSLERFREQFHSVTRRRESPLSDRQEQQELLFHVDRYVGDSSEELAQVNSQVRAALDDERERLLRDRNALPWE